MNTPYFLRCCMNLLMIFAAVGCGAHSDARAACPAIEVSAVADAPGDSTRAVTLNDSTMIALARTPLVTSADITGANASQNGDEWIVNLSVNDAAAKRVHDYSKQHIGRTVAVLVDGKVRGTPRIADTLSGKAFMIDGYKRADAEQLAAALRDGCKP